MRIHSLHHATFEGLGTIAAWAHDAGHTEIAASLVEHCPEDLRPGRFVQPSTAILGETWRFGCLELLMRHVLGGFQEVAARVTAR